MKKSDLITAILGEVEEDIQADIQKKIDESGDEKITDNRDYKKNMQLGTLVAFIVGNKLLTAKIDSIHSGGFTVETKKGIKHTISQDKIAWVKTGTRWPKHIFRVLTGELGVDTICLK